MTPSTVSTIGIAGVACFVIAAVAGAFLIPGYSQVSQHISESYAMDTKYGLYLRLLGYIPSGLLILLFGFLSSKYIPTTKSSKVALAGIGLFYGGGTLLTGIFPCDAGCNPEMIDPSVAQHIHNLSGLLTYITAPFFVIVLGFAAIKWKNGNGIGKWILYAGFVSFVFLVLFFSLLNSPYGGLVQRILEGSVLLSILVTSIYIHNSPFKND